MIKLVTYYTKPFYASKNRLIKSAKKINIRNIKVYNDIWLRNQNFYHDNIEILSQPRGAGYWLWKPYIILKELKNLTEDDFLIYSDAGIEFTDKIDSLLPYVNKNNGFGLFCVHGYRNIEYTKHDCFKIMNCDEEKYWNGKKIMAGFNIFKKNNETINFVTEWLQYATNKFVITDLENVYSTNYPEFIDHRHDQSILSLLTIKYGLKSFRDPSQWGNPWKSINLRVYGEFIEVPYSSEPWDEYNYSTLINIHRERNNLNPIDKLRFYIIQKISNAASNIGNHRWFK
jgi:hypothetical protein